VPAAFASVAPVEHFGTSQPAWRPAAVVEQRTGDTESDGTDAPRCPTVLADGRDMKISAKAEYACLAVLELALRAGQSEPVRAADIAEANDIPQRFLVQILLQLKGAGYVASVRGAAGGYRLAREPEQINLWEIIESIDGPSSAHLADQTSGKSFSWKVLRSVWDTVTRAEQEHLAKINFAQLVEEAGRPSAHMYYI
jgi:Rrf2 family protein